MGIINHSHALLLIDIQNKVIDFKSITRPSETEIAFNKFLERISKLQTWARDSDLATIHVQHDGGKGSRIERDSQGWQIRNEIDVQPKDPIFYKTHCSSFSGTGLNDYLKKNKIDSLIIAGCMTNFCIDTTCRIAIEKGYNVILAADGHMTCDNDGLTFEQIIKHHNSILADLSADNACIKVVPVNKIISLTVSAD